MRKLGLFGGIALALVTGVVSVRAGDESKKDSPAAVAFARLKKLAGDWTKGDGKVSRTYKVVGRGSTLMERLLPGTPFEMVTMYHLDGDDLVLTHYCALGNQPHMKAKLPFDGKTLAFEFVSGTNMDPKTDAHMHETTFTFTDDDHMRSTWTSYEKGEKKEPDVFDLSRMKK